MGRNLAADVRAATEALHSAEPWVWLYYIELLSGDYIAITNNNEPVNYPSGGDVVYMPYPVGQIEMSEDTDGNLTVLTVTVGNIGRQISDLLEAGQLTGQQITVRMVSTAYLVDGDAALEQTFTIQDVTLDALNANFRLGAPPLFEMMFPRRTFNRSMCPRIFGTSADPAFGCDWDGVTGPSTCAHNLTACRLHNNVINFGGFPGIPRRYA